MNGSRSFLKCVAFFQTKLHIILLRVSSYMIANTIFFISLKKFIDLNFLGLEIIIIDF